MTRVRRGVEAMKGGGSLKEMARLAASAEAAGTYRGSCRGCRFYQPKFRYRVCIFARCPYHRDRDPFRKRKE